MKQTLKIGITVLVVAVMTMSGIALAQTSDSTDDVNQNAVTRLAEKLQTLVDDGTISADQAQAVAEFLAAEGPMGGRGGPEGRQGPHFGDIAEFLGMDPADFREAIQEYDTLADLAEANGSSADELIAYLVGQAEDHLAQAVDNGRITQDEADEKLAEATDRITEMVNSEIPDGAGQRGPRAEGEFGGPAQGGFGGQPPVDSGAAA